MSRRAVVAALTLALVGASTRRADATSYCIDQATGSDSATGAQPDCWRSFAPALQAAFVAGDRVFIRPGRYVFPTTAWYMTPGVSWAGAGPHLTTVVVDTGAPVPFVRFRTGSAGSGSPNDLRDFGFGPSTSLSGMRLLNEGAATVGVDVKVTSGDSSPALVSLVIEGFATGISLHPSSDERASASTHALITNDVIRSATVAAIDSYADVFYPNLVQEASTVTNAMGASTGAGVRIRTLVNDLRDASSAVVEPYLRHVTMAAGAESAIVLEASYDDGTGAAVTLQEAGTFAPRIVGSILTGSERFAVEETSPFTEPALVFRNAMGGNAMGDRLDEGSVVRIADAASENRSIAPVFVDVAGGDLHVMPASPTVDLVAASEAPPEDVDGHARPQGALSDLGADELVPCSATASVTLAQGAACTGDDSILDATGSAVDSACPDGPRFEWSVSGTLVGEGAVLAVNPRATTTYRLRVTCADPTMSACHDETDTVVSSSQGPATADAGPDMDACLPEGPVVVALDGTASVGDALTYLWTASAGTIASPSAPRTELAVDLVDATRIITVTLRVAPAGSTCFSTDTTLVTLRPEPISLPGGPYSVIDSGAPSDTLALDGSASRGEAPLTYRWTTDLGAFQDTGTTSSALPNPILVVPDGPADQRGVACLVTTAGNGCSDLACTRVSVLQAAVLPPNDVGPTLRVTKREPRDVRLEWQDPPVDALHDAADAYQVRTSSRACGPFALRAVVADVPGADAFLDPALREPPPLRFYFIGALNDGGSSVPRAPDASGCR